MRISTGDYRLDAEMPSDAPPQEGEVIVGWKVAGLCHSDEHMITGDMVPPEEAWAEVKQRLLDYRHNAPEGYEHVLWLASNASVAKPDKQHRILIPGFLRDAAHLDGTVLLVGALDRIEIWNPDDFGERIQPAGPDFDRFAHQIFG